MLGRGFEREGFKKVLQSWCLFTKIEFPIMARMLEEATGLPSLNVIAQASSACSGN